MFLIRSSFRCPQHVEKLQRRLSSAASPATSPFAPRHLLSIADLSSSEVTTLIRNAHAYKRASKSGATSNSLIGALTGKSIALIFNKRSTRTRVSCESAIASMGGHPMFLGKDDIQLGVNESLHDSAVVISSMVEGIYARVAAHSDIVDFAKDSTVPVINALSDDFHPMQTIADYLTIAEAFQSTPKPERSAIPSLGLEGLKIAWVGDANNVLYDLAIGAAKLGVDISVATPKGYEIPERMKKIILDSGKDAKTQGKLMVSNVPEDAVKNADLLVTDTWVSMGQEAEASKKMKAFEGFQITDSLAERGGAKPGWKFMHCLPRHPQEVSDEVFYSPRSLVFQEAANRLWAAVAVLEGFVTNRGRIMEANGR